VSNFVKLTTAKDKSPVWVNLDLVASIWPQAGYPTEISFTNKVLLVVAETPEEILGKDEII
jgi:hypothetical protein